ncbi:cytochrome c oxidase subunit CcoM [Maribrevibacterium harenarium]
MFLDDVVLAGVITVGLMVGFLGVFGVIAYRRISKEKK